MYTHKNSKRNFAFSLFIFHFLFFIFMFLFRKTLYRRYLQLYAYLEKEKSLSRSSSLILLSAIVISLEVITHNSRKILQYFNCRCDYCKACLHASVILSQPLEVVLFVHYYRRYNIKYMYTMYAYLVEGKNKINICIHMYISTA